MFKRVITHKGFFKSALILGLIYGVVLFLIQWAFRGFYEPFLNVKNVCYSLLSGIIAGLFISYGKFWAKLKQIDHKNK
ncbi:hypothetical protein SCB49_09080 [unidentified eubacterium SCB49]|nr:hypothetical protein SCB49_09080 [unidentified eubacterium SCB49]